MVRKLSLDFTDVKDSGGMFNKSRIPAGDYLAKVVKVEDATVKATGAFQWLFTIKLVNKHVTSAFPYYCQTESNTLWKVRNLLVAAGVNVPKRKFQVDPTKVVGRQIAVTIQDTEYDGKQQSEIGNIFPAAELLGTGDEGVSATDDDEDGEDETEQVDEDTEEEPEAEVEAEEADQFEDMDRNALKAFIKEHDAEFKVFKSTTDDALREKARSISVPLDEPEEPEEEEEEDEEEPPPPPKKVAKPATKRPATRRAPKAVTDDEDLDIEDM